MAHFHTPMDTTPHHRIHRPPPPPPQRKHQRRKESLKVVYISTPMKVRTSASRFRSLVQHLTGKNSDIAPYMDADGGAVVDYRDEDGMLLPDNRIPPSVSSDETTAAASDSADNAFVVSRFEDQFRGLFSSDLCEMDVLGSYDGLIM